MSPIWYGNAFSNNATREDCLREYPFLSSRVFEFSDDIETQCQIGSDLLAIAESGLDFNMRFKTSKSKVAAHEFAHVDLNCFLYAVELTISKIMKELNRDDESNRFISKANKRKKLMDKYFLNNEEHL